MHVGLKTKFSDYQYKILNQINAQVIEHQN